MSDNLQDIPTSVRLTLAELARVDAMAAAKGYKRSELLRIFVRRGLRYAEDVPAKERLGAVRPEGGDAPAEPIALNA